MDNIWKLLKEYNFQQGDEIKSDVLCRACQKILVKPLIVSCGCRYCSDCLYNYLHGERKICLGNPVYCQNEYIHPDEDIFLDRAACISISRIVLKCPLEVCTFRSELKNMTDHLTTCRKEMLNCPFQSLGCQKKEIPADEINNHFNQECYSHFRLMMEVMDNLKNEIKGLKMELSELKDENKNLKDKIRIEGEKVKSFNLIVLFYLILSGCDDIIKRKGNP